MSLGYAKLALGVNMCACDRLNNIESGQFIQERLQIQRHPDQDNAVSDEMNE